MRALAATLLLAVLSSTSPARADERPVTRPTRDVDVTYVATAGDTAIRQRTRTLAGAAEIRIDTPSPGLYMIVNRDARTMEMVSEADKGAIEIPYDSARAGGMAADGASYRRIGTAEVAGLSCTEWATTDTGGHEVAACFTSDGVLLRARAGARVMVQAASVTYGKLDPALFAVPAGFDRKAAPKRP